MIERSFAENERMIREELTKMSKTESPEFSIVFRKLSSLDQELERLLGCLRGPEYKKTIAEVVTRDFNAEINDLRTISISARNSYTQNLSEVEMDRSRVEAIRDNLQKIYFVHKKGGNHNVLQTSAHNTMNTHIHEVGSGLFSLARDKAEQPVAQSRTRKSFFNFGSD